MKINPYSEISRIKISERLKTAKKFGFEVVDDFDPQGDSDTPNSPWHLISKAVLNRDGYSCRVCGKSQFAPVEGSGNVRKVRLNVEVHHIIPRKMKGSDSFRNLITLCSECHKITYKNRYQGLPGREGRLTSYAEKVLVAIPKTLASDRRIKTCRVDEMQRVYDQENVTYRVIEQEDSILEVTAVEIDYQNFAELAEEIEKEFGATSYYTVECKCPLKQKLRLFLDHDRNVIA